MSKSSFFYQLYIRTTPKKLWAALTQAEFTRRYWVETWQVSDWNIGSEWKLMIPDGRVGDSGKILDIIPEQRLILAWRNEFQPALKEEGYSQATLELEPQGDCVKLTVIHEMDREHSAFIEGVSDGWPMILSSMKSLLETGESLAQTRHWPEGM